MMSSNIATTTNMPSYKTNDNNHNSNKHIDSSDKINSPLQQLQTNSTKNKSSSTQVSSSPSFTNLRRSSPIPKDLSILCINFNQDHGCFAVGHELGFLVYNTDPIELRVKRNFSIGGNTPSRYNLNTSSTAATTSPLSGSGIGHITMLHRTNYLAVVGGGTNPRFPINKLVIWDDLKRKNSLSLEFDKPVLNVLLSRIKIVVILIDEIIVYSFASPPKKLITFETHRNEFGVADMSVTTSSTTGTTAAATERKPRAYSDTHTNDRLGPVPRGSHASISSAGSTASNASVGSGTSLNSILNHNNKNSNNVHQPSTILVFPGKAIGQIQIVDLAQQQPGSSVNIIKAHKSAIRNLCINKTGTMVASASVLGTLIRIHSTSTTQLLYEFRRGIDRADITSMKFSHDDSKLAVLSDKYTLHIFNLGEEEPEEETSPEHHHQENKHHALTKYINFLPSTLIPQYFKSTWSYCSVNTNQYHQQESELDTGSLGWVSDDEVVIVWQKKKIWEKYTIMEKSGGDGDEEYEIVRTSWKSLDSE